MASTDTPAPVRRDLDLLARVKYRDADGGPRECFGNIIELGGRALRLESSRELAAGALLVLHVVFPGQRRYEKPVVQIPCAVRKAHDHPNLHYDLAITVLEPEAHERLRLYLDRPAVATASGA